MQWKFIFRRAEMDKFRELCVWNGDVLEDVRFWCEPDLTKEALQLITKNSLPQFDAFATFHQCDEYNEPWPSGVQISTLLQKTFHLNS